MCLYRNIEHVSSIQPIYDPNEEFNLEWPLNQSYGPRLIIACNTCYYPISYEENILSEIRNGNNISFAYVIPIIKLFRRVGIYGENFTDQWKTIIFCTNCGIVLSFINPQMNSLNMENFNKITDFKNYNEQICILWFYPLFRGSSEEAFIRFSQINEN